jgi:hypothetical protein
MSDDVQLFICNAKSLLQIDRNPTIHVRVRSKFRQIRKKEVAGLKFEKPCSSPD